MNKVSQNFECPEKRIWACPIIQGQSLAKFEFKGPKNVNINFVLLRANCSQKLSIVAGHGLTEW